VTAAIPMSMIFDNFPSLEKAEAFAKKVREHYCLRAQVFMEENQAQEHDRGPEVHVDRVVLVVKEKGVRNLRKEIAWTIAIEEGVEKLVEEFGGVYIGT